MTTTKLLEAADLGKIVYVFAASMGMLQRLHLILDNSPFPCFIAILFYKILLEIRTFTNLFKSFNPYHCRLLDQFIKVLMTCFTYVQFFIKLLLWMIKLWCKNLIFFMFSKSDPTLLQASMAYCPNVLGALFYLLKNILNLITTFFHLLWFLIPGFLNFFC